MTGFGALNFTSLEGLEEDTDEPEDLRVLSGREAPALLELPELLALPLLALLLLEAEEALVAVCWKEHE